MITTILRRASSTLSRRTIPAAAAEILFSTTAATELRHLTARSFHSKSQPLLFRASSTSHSGYAAEAFPYEEPSKSNSDEGLEIAKLGISQDIVSALEKKGITKLFPIQRAVLEPAMQGRDMIGRARTGTGKTLAFGIPIIDKIIQFNAKHGTRPLDTIYSNFFWLCVWAAAKSWVCDEQGFCNMTTHPSNVEVQVYWSSSNTSSICIKFQISLSTSSR